MTVEDISNQLELIATSGEVEAISYELVDKWRSASVGLEAVEPILHFMERHPSVDFGTPGPLVHFAEKFYGAGYEEKLVESIQRKPTAHTLWMLNGLINGTTDHDIRQSLITILEQARWNTQADERAIEWANKFLGRIAE